MTIAGTHDATLIVLSILIAMAAGALLFTLIVSLRRRSI